MHRVESVLAADTRGESVTPPPPANLDKERPTGRQSVLPDVTSSFPICNGLRNVASQPRGHPYVSSSLTTPFLGGNRSPLQRGNSESLSWRLWVYVEGAPSMTMGADPIEHDWPIGFESSRQMATAAMPGLGDGRTDRELAYGMNDVRLVGFHHRSLCRRRDRHRPRGV